MERKMIMRGRGRKMWVQREMGIRELVRGAK